MGKKKASWKHITIFDRLYSREKQAEGMAVHQAVATGACDKCCFLAQCSADDNFKSPVFAWCHRRKYEILTAMRNASQGGVLS